jgi:hypothetical protein
MDADELEADNIGVLKRMMDDKKWNAIDENGVIVAGSDYEKYVKYCADRVDPWGETAQPIEGGEVDEDWATGEKCTTDNQEFDDYGTYTTDCSVKQAMDDEACEPPPAPCSSTDSSIAPGNAPGAGNSAAPPENYSRTTYKGKTFNQRTVAMLKVVDENLKAMGLAPASYNQGSYNPGGVGASAGTHDGGGAVDIDILSYPHSRWNDVLKAVRMAGFAAWIRFPSEGPWNYHLHAMAIGDKEISKPVGSGQIVDYFNGKNGLKGHAPDRYANNPGYPIPEWAKAFSNGKDPGSAAPTTACVCPTSPIDGTNVVGGTNKDYAGRDLFTAQELAKIKANQPIYEEAAKDANIPWQLLAVVHYRESSLERLNLKNGQGVFQFLDKRGGPYPTGPVSEAEFLRQAKIAAHNLVDDAKNDNYPGHKDLNVNSDAETIKDTLFSYNGRARVYVRQAASLGYDANTKGYEGSPYVMNIADAKRDPSVNKTTWGQIQTDHGTISYPAGSDYGAFVEYTALTGMPSGGGCS